MPTRRVQVYNAMPWMVRTWHEKAVCVHSGLRRHEHVRFDDTSMKPHKKKRARDLVFDIITDATGSLYTSCLVLAQTCVFRCHLPSVASVNHNLARNQSHWRKNSSKCHKDLPKTKLLPPIKLPLLSSPPLPTTCINKRGRRSLARRGGRGSSNYHQ
jgi:hypothetical protein